jgi:curved DNA-binding protein CbpA
VSRNQLFDPSINYYAVLDVPLDATREEITRTYRQLMRVTHPDNFTEPRDRLKAEERSKLINAAYTVLSKPDIRQEYDKVMRHRLMADVVMQRYTGGSPGRPSPLERERRTPSAQTIQAQRAAYRSAVWQLMLTTAAVALGLVVVIIVGAAAFSGLRLLF